MKDKITVPMYLYAWHHEETDTICYHFSPTDGMERLGYVLLNTVEAEIDKPDIYIDVLRAKVLRHKEALKQKQIAELQA